MRSPFKKSNKEMRPISTFFVQKDLQLCVNFTAVTDLTEPKRDIGTYGVGERAVSRYATLLENRC